MNAVSKNLKQIRQAEGMTQDQLAEALHVTRQAVSSWETGRSEPDIETLLALADALGTNADELIYGPKPAEYARRQKKYIIRCIVFGAVCLAGIAARIWLQPWLIAYKGRTFDPLPYFIYLMALIPLFFAAGGALFGSLLSLGLDLRLKKNWRIICLFLGLACLVPTLATAAQLIGPLKESFQLFYPFLRNTVDAFHFWTRYAPALGGFLLFRGFNRR